jgi:hypothetical protein
MFRRELTQLVTPPISMTASVASWISVFKFHSNFADRFGSCISFSPAISPHALYCCNFCTLVASECPSETLRTDSPAKPLMSKKARKTWRRDGSCRSAPGGLTGHVHQRLYPRFYADL